MRKRALRFLDDKGEVIRGKVTPFRVWSISKTITAIARAYEQGKEILPDILKK